MAEVLTRGKFFKREAGLAIDQSKYVTWPGHLSRFLKFGEKRLASPGVGLNSHNIFAWKFTFNAG